MRCASFRSAVVHLFGVHSAGVATVALVSGCGAPAVSQTPAETSGNTDNAVVESEQPSGPVADAPAAEPRGPVAPDFELEAIDGQSIRLSDHRGRVVLIDFWATYCDPCLAAMPHLNDIYRDKRDDGLVILGVSIDGPESLAEVRTTASKLGVEFPILLDDESSVVARYNPRLSAPYSVLVGRDGTIRARREGYTTGSAEGLVDDIRAALAE